MKLAYLFTACLLGLSIAAPIVDREVYSRPSQPEASHLLERSPTTVEQYRKCKSHFFWLWYVCPKPDDDQKEKPSSKEGVKQIKRAEEEAMKGGKEAEKEAEKEVEQQTKVDDEKVVKDPTYKDSLVQSLLFQFEPRHLSKRSPYTHEDWLRCKDVWFARARGLPWGVALPDRPDCPEPRWGEKKDPSPEELRKVAEKQERKDRKKAEKAEKKQAKADRKEEEKEAKQRAKANRKTDEMFKDWVLAHVKRGLGLKGETE